MLSSQVDRDEPLYIYGPPRIREFVEAMRRTLDMYINYEIVVREVGAGCDVVQGEGYRRRAPAPSRTRSPAWPAAWRRTQRPGIFLPEQAAALGVPRGPMWSHAAGRRDVTLPDGRAVQLRPRSWEARARAGSSASPRTPRLRPGLAEFARGSDLFICEGMFAEELAETAAEKKHLTAAQAARIAREAGGEATSA